MKGVDKNIIEPALDVFLNLLKKYSKRILGAVILISFEACLILPLPIIMGKIIDEALPQKNIKILIQYLLLLLIFNATNSVIQYYKAVTIYRLNNRIVIDMRIKLLEKISYLNYELYEKKSIGYLMSRIKDDTTRLANIVFDELIYIFKHIVVLIVSLITVILLDWRLTLVSFGLIPVFLFTIIRYGKIIRILSQESFEKVSICDKTLDESIRSIPLCRSYNRDKLFLLRYFHNIKFALFSLMKLKKAESSFFSIMLFLGSILPAGIFAYGGYGVISDRISVGKLVTFIGVLNNFIQPAAVLMNFNVLFKKMFVSLERIGEYLSIKNITNKKDATVGGDKTISLKNVSFSYSESNKITLSSIDFSAQRGDIIAIMGNSGVGKSTLCKIIAGLLPFEGTITIGKEGINKNNYSNLTKIVAWIPQEVQLLNDSVLNNVTLGNKHASLIDVESALKKANAWEFVGELKLGIHTLVGKDGHQLSAGQYQRIALARAILKEPKILVMDEALANVDHHSSLLILEAIRSISKDMIVFAITHSRENMFFYNRIFTLVDGKISENIQQAVHNIYKVHTPRTCIKMVNKDDKN